MCARARDNFSVAVLSALPNLASTTFYVLMKLVSSYVCVASDLFIFYRIPKVLVINLKSASLKKPSRCFIWTRLKLTQIATKMEIRLRFFAKQEHRTRQAIVQECKLIVVKNSR